MANISAVQSILNKAKEQKAASASKGSNGPRIAFLPEGRHKIRFFLDPSEQMYREVRTYKTEKGRVMDPNFWRQAGVDPKGVEIPDNNMYDILDELGNWRLNPRFEVIAYGHLYNTDSKSDYWEPGNTYLIVGNGKMRDALLSFMQDLVEDSPEYLMSSINHNLAGNASNVTVVKGQQGSVTITPTMSNPEDPISIEGELKPLTESYVADFYEPEKWKLVVEEYTKLLEEKRAEDAKNEGNMDPAEQNDQSGDTPAEGSEANNGNNSAEGQTSNQSSSESSGEQKADSSSEESNSQNAEKSKAEPQQQSASSEGKSDGNDDAFWNDLGLKS